MYNLLEYPAFIIATGLPCIMEVWEGHWTPISDKLLNHAREFAVCVENMHGYSCSKPCAKKHFSCNHFLHAHSRTIVTCNKLLVADKSPDLLKEVTMRRCRLNHDQSDHVLDVTVLSKIGSKI